MTHLCNQTFDYQVKLSECLLSWSLASTQPKAKKGIRELLKPIAEISPLCYNPLTWYLHYAFVMCVDLLTFFCSVTVKSSCDHVHPGQPESGFPGHPHSCLTQKSSTSYWLWSEHCALCWQERTKLTSVYQTGRKHRCCYWGCTAQSLQSDSCR